MEREWMSARTQTLRFLRSCRDNSSIKAASPSWEKLVCLARREYHRGPPCMVWKNTVVGWSGGGCAEDDSSARITVRGLMSASMSQRLGMRTSRRWESANAAFSAIDGCNKNQGTNFRGFSVYTFIAIFCFYMFTEHQWFCCSEIVFFKIVENTGQNCYLPIVFKPPKKTNKQKTPLLDQFI